MARRRTRRSVAVPVTRQRDVVAPKRRSLSPIGLLPRSAPLRRPTRIGDRRSLASRLFGPVRQDLTPSRVVAARPSKGGKVHGPSPLLSFRGPKSTLVCVRRNERREVLHAKGVAGGRVSSRRRRNENSEIICRRKRK